MAVEKLITQHIDTWTSALRTRSTAGRGSNGKIDLYGIKKLRELILELAVRGKLVPQDPTDEPASELLKRIAAEKAELVKQGKIKKQKPLPEISEDEKPFELPMGWEWVRLNDIMADIHYGYTTSADETKKIKLLRITDIQDDKVNWATVPGCDISEKMTEQYKLKDNDIVIARTGGTVGKSYLVENINVPSVFASYLIRLKYLPPMQAEFTKIFLGSQLYWKQLYDGTSGTGQPNVNGNTLKAIILPVAPIDEQNNIIFKVKELMSLCDQLEQQSLTSLDAHSQLVETLLATLTDSQNAEELAENWARISQHFDTLFTTEASIDALKQTILQLAVMGKLVPQDPTDEPASELLKRIEREKAQLVKEGKIKKQKPLPPISEDEKPFELPVGWEWCKLQDITSKITDGDHKTPPRINDGYKLLSAKNVRDGYLDYDNCDYISEVDYLKSRERCLPEIGDLLIVSVGGTIGRSSLIKESADFALVRSVAIIKPLLLDSNYLKFSMDSFLLQKIIHESKRGGAQPCLYLSEISNFLFPMPPEKEQKRIVSKIEYLLSICDRLKSRLQSAQQTQLHLADALTDAALN
ncbi:restriction endonuclease subunit S [Yersinia enterocolitica]|uniref:restriction endonuclease subunit S n=1 Tax=Yersinia TaxID=629 RepID=UPI0005E6AC1B|nr:MULTISPECIES: restriction endonuclease subunit S [Yersinia]EKN3528700.1 restriction endonuclease subunit S [Yersinia enterocolitica]EKN3569489.1 restriction endonuclease subunit S [Yersinia enterocolitica]EKN4118615.1 restriction endonuclease subunit S [Yersinia enterocolitica]EKN4743730.1 restriction endonuclease subunit S [Yersinia enterocolitica]EKN4839031.1 restriction endonuclease subunit S [Yersinia enterocolitica]